MDVVKTVNSSRRDPAFHRERVYIGVGSIWHRKDAKCLNDYKKLVTAEEIDQLKDKILECKCDFWKRCHGHVLMYLCSGDVNVEEFSPNSPLSNSYPFSFVYKGETFESLLHAYYWEKSGQSASVLRARDKKAILNAAKSACVAYLSTHETIRLLFSMLSMKYQQCAAFREALSSDNFLIEDREKNPFFGKGEGTNVCNYDGQNVLGWLLMYVQEQQVVKLRRRLILACKGIMNVDMVRGLKLIVDAFPELE